MTIQFPEGTPFSYHEGNLLVGIAQINNGYSNACQISWYAAGTNTNSALFEPYGEDPTCIQSLPKVTFTYEPDAYLPPTDFDVQFLSATELYLSWTPRPGQHHTNIAIATDPDFSTTFAMTNSDQDHCIINLQDDHALQPETPYYLRAQGAYAEGNETYYYSAWTPTFVLITPDACPPPANLQVTEVGPFSANLSWESDAEFCEVEYREFAPQWEEGFEGSINSSLPSGWLGIVNGSGSQAGRWKAQQDENYSHSGQWIVRSDGLHHSGITTDNWLILPQIELGGVLKFWASTIYGNATSFSVYVSTTGTAIADFGSTPILTGTTLLSYEEFTVDLTGYDGSGYVAIRHQHYGPTEPSATLAIDDVTYLTCGDWQPLGLITENSMTVEGLTPGLTYQFRVSGNCNTGYNSDWAVSESITTTENIEFETST